jgi:signal transduction histidine kinase
VKALADHAAFSIYNIKTLDRQRLLSYDESIESISAFARTVRHNLEPQFSNIRKLAEEVTRSPDVGSLVTQIQRLAADGLRKAEDLVEMAPHLGQPVLPIKPVYVLGSVMESFRDGKLHLDLRRECDDHITVLGRHSVLAFCLGQVLQNSRQHGATNVEVTVRTGQSPSKSDQVIEIILRDDGPGVPSAYVREIFEPQKENLKTMGRGEALGLCRLYIRHMGGEMDAEEVKPHGLAVLVRLPIARIE